MNQQHRDSYAQLLGQWQAFSDLSLRSSYAVPGVWTPLVLGVIAEYEREHGVRVRPDGKLLLAMNFDLMIGQPLAMAGNRGELRETGVNEIVRDDVRMLLDAASDPERQEIRRGLRDDDQEISAHRLVNALSGNWNRLKSAAQNLWD